VEKIPGEVSLLVTVSVTITESGKSTIRAVPSLLDTPLDTIKVSE
jgi:hypothetical protein